LIPDNHLKEMRCKKATLPFKLALLLRRDLANWHRDIAQIGTPCGYVEKGIPPIGACLGIGLKTGTITGKNCKTWALFDGQIRHKAKGINACPFFGVRIKAQSGGSSRQGREMLYPLHNSANHSDIAIQMTRRMANHGIEFCARARIRR
jgi:hypothetical protein